MERYLAPRWLIGGNAQTIWPALFSRRFDGPVPHFTRERWAAPDGDFIDVDWQEASAPASESPPDAPPPLLVLFHGLEGSSASHYAQAFAHWARAHGWRFVVPHFRGCSGELNLAPRAYHSGDFEEIDWILRRVHRQHRGRVAAVGVSLGGNALLARSARSRRRSTWRPAAARSAPASTGRSTRRCSCAR
jgi:predicted alpha/beta-fold hydrolase